MVFHGTTAMAKLHAAERNKLPNSEFAGPDRSYPVNDPPHAKNAKSRASQAEHEGRMSKAEESKIDAKADRVLYGSTGRKKPAERVKTPSGMHHKKD